MARSKPKWFVPQWEGVIEGYVVNTLKANFFRVEATMTEDDYLQEAYMVYLRVATKYAGKIKADEPQHFTALFKRSWANHLNDLSNEDTRYRETFVSDQREQADSSSVRDITAERAGETDNEGVLATLLRQAPREVSMVMNLFLNAPAELLEVALEPWRGRDARCKAGGSEHVCKLLGLPRDRDVMRHVEEYFATNS